MAFSTPGRVVLGLPSPSPRVCTDGRTLTSQPKFFGPIDYQISSAMELRWRVSPAGSAIIAKTSKSQTITAKKLLYVLLSENVFFNECKDTAKKTHVGKKEGLFVSKGFIKFLLPPKNIGTK